MIHLHGIQNRDSDSNSKQHIPSYQGIRHFMLKCEILVDYSYYQNPWI